MRELTSQEVNDVSGGLDWGSGGLAVISLGFMSPVTTGFGLAIGGSMLLVDLYLS